MSRLNVAALQSGKAGNGEYEAPEVDVSPEPWRPPQQRQQEQQLPQDETPKHLKAIHETLQQNQQLVQQTQLLNHLTQNPQIRALLEAQQQGKQMKLVEDDPTGLPPADDTDPNWEELGQDPQKMAQYLTKKIVGDVSRGLIPAVKGLIEKQFQPVQQLAQQVQQMGGFIQNMQRQQVNAEIDRVRNQAPEIFDQLRPVMGKISENNPGLSADDLFFLARKQTGMLNQPNAQQMGTERPTQNTGARPQPQSNPLTQALLEQPQGRQLNPHLAFQQTLGSLIDKRFGDGAGLDINNRI